MKRVVLIGLFLLWGKEVAAQSITKKYYDKAGVETDSANSYSFKVMIYESRDGLPKPATFYTATQKLKIKTDPQDQGGEEFKTYYYPNGAVRAQGNFYKGQPKGLVHTFYDNGKPQGELLFEDNKVSRSEAGGMGIINYWDSTGNLLVNIGEGFCKCELNPFSDEKLVESGKVAGGVKEGKWGGLGESGSHPYSFTEDFENGVLLKGIQTYRGKSYTYKEVNEAAEPHGGMDGFYQHAFLTFKYPQNARRKNIEGRVYVEFTVDIDGTIKHVHVVQGIDPECDEEAVRVVSTAPPWQPRLYRGRPLPQVITFPILFKLR